MGLTFQEKEAAKAAQKQAKEDKAFAKKQIGVLAPQKVELTSLKEKTAGFEHLVPAHVLAHAAKTSAKLNEVYGRLELIFKGEKTVEETNPDRKAFEEEVKSMASEGHSAIERLRVQVQEIIRWNQS